MGQKNCLPTAEDALFYNLHWLRRMHSLVLFGFCFPLGSTHFCTSRMLLTQHYPRCKQRGNAPVHRLIEGGTKDFTFLQLLFVLCWRGTPRGGPRGLHKCCWAALQNCCCNPLLQRIQNTNRTSDTLARLLNNETLH